MSPDPVLAALKPSLRGVLHQWAAPVALGAGVVLVAMAPDLRAGLACAVFATSLVTLFTVSATYHRVTWQPAARAWMRRADHASIFVLIAGTYTPIALLGLPSATGTKLSLLVWTGAALGVLQSLFWVHAPKWVVAVLAVAVGWSIVPYLGEVRHAVPGFVQLLIALGGVAYTLGAVTYALKKPDLKAGVFGYHEVFHACTLVGASAHLAAVIGLLKARGG
jgi:hemolysin III